MTKPPSEITRRQFLKTAGAALAVPALLAACNTPAPPLAGTAEPAPLPPLSQISPAFRHGVASGDPGTDRVMLWTRLSSEPLREAELDWAIALDPELRQIVARGRATARAANDYTVKIDAAGLAPGTPYHYRFWLPDGGSPIGRTRTLPVGALDQLKLAVVSCGAFDGGYFNVYRAIADSEVEAVLHLGDFIYEGIGPDSNPLGRVHQPRKRTVTVDEYRTRYRQYRDDPDLQALLAAHPVIHIWDDHELANNCWKDGAEGHKPEDGDWQERKRAATQVFHEWLPIRPDPGGDLVKIWRSFRFGDLAELAMLETRIAARDGNAIGPAVDDPARQMLGAEQLQWLQDRLQAPVVWKLIGQSIQMAPLNYLTLPQLLGSALGASVVIGAGGIPVSYDSWDGDAAERRRLYDYIQSTAIDNVVVLTGDNHYAFAADLIPDPGNPLSAPIAVEFGTTAASSSTGGSGSNDDLLRRLNPWIRYFEPERNGWIELLVRREATTARYFSVASTQVRSPEASLTAERSVLAGSNRLVAEPLA